MLEKLRQDSAVFEGSWFVFIRLMLTHWKHHTHRVQQQQQQQQSWGSTAAWTSGCAPLKLMQSFQISLFSGWSVDFKLIVDKRWVWGTFKSDPPDSTSFEGDLCSLPFQDQTLKSVTLSSGLNCSPVLIPSWTPQSLTSTANITCASLSLQETLRPYYVNCGYSRLIWVTYSY